MTRSRRGYRLSEEELRRLEARLVAGEALTRLERQHLESHVMARWQAYVGGCCRRHALRPDEIDDAIHDVFVQILKNLRKRTASTMQAIAAGGVEGADFRRHIARIAYNTVVEGIRRRRRRIDTEPWESGDPDRAERQPSPEAVTIAPHDVPDLFEETLGEALTAGVIRRDEAELLRDRIAGMELYPLALTHGLADKATKTDTARGYASKAVTAVVGKIVAFRKREGH